MDKIRKNTDDPKLDKLCTLIKANYGYPVDSVLISKDLEVTGHVNINEPTATNPTAYAQFLRRGLAKARGTPLPAEAEVVVKTVAARATRPRPSLVLTPDQPSGDVLNVVQSRGFGKLSALFVYLDATAFKDGGEFDVTITLGGAKTGAKFELCAPMSDGQRGVAPVRTISLDPEETAKLNYEFDAGAHFMIVAKPATGSAEDDANAFRAQVRVKPR